MTLFSALMWSQSVHRISGVLLMPWTFFIRASASAVVQIRRKDRKVNRANVTKWQVMYAKSGTPIEEVQCSSCIMESWTPSELRIKRVTILQLVKDNCLHLIAF